MLKAVNSFDSSSKGICQKPIFKSNVVKTLFCTPIDTNMSVRTGRGCLSCKHFLCSYWYSTTGLLVPSYFSAKNNEKFCGEFEGSMTARSNIFSTILSNVNVGIYKQVCLLIVCLAIMVYDA